MVLAAFPAEAAGVAVVGARVEAAPRAAAAGGRCRTPGACWCFGSAVVHGFNGNDVLSKDYVGRSG